MHQDDGSVRYGRDFNKHICTTFQSRCQGTFSAPGNSTMMRAFALFAPIFIASPSDVLPLLPCRQRLRWVQSEYRIAPELRAPQPSVFELLQPVDQRLRGSQSAKPSSQQPFACPCLSLRKQSVHVDRKVDLAEYLGENLVKHALQLVTAMLVCSSLFVVTSSSTSATPSLQAGRQQHMPPGPHPELLLSTSKDSKPAFLQPRRLRQSQAGADLSSSHTETIIGRSTAPTPMAPAKHASQIPPAWITRLA